MLHDLHELSIWQIDWWKNSHSQLFQSLKSKTLGLEFQSGGILQKEKDFTV